MSTRPDCSGRLQEMSLRHREIRDWSKVTPAGIPAAGASSADFCVIAATSAAQPVDDLSGFEELSTGRAVRRLRKGNIATSDLGPPAPLRNGRPGDSCQISNILHRHQCFTHCASHPECASIDSSIIDGPETLLWLFTVNAHLTVFPLRRLRRSGLNWVSSERRAFVLFTLRLQQDGHDETQIQQLNRITRVGRISRAAMNPNSSTTLRSLRHR